MKFLPQATSAVETVKRTISSLALPLGAVYIQVPLPCWVFYTESCPSKTPTAPWAPCEASATDQPKSLQLHQLSSPLSFIYGTDYLFLCSSCNCHSICLCSTGKGHVHAEGAEHGHCQLATGICFPAASAGVEHVFMNQASAGGTRPGATSGRLSRGCRAFACGKWQFFLEPCTGKLGKKNQLQINLLLHLFYL